MTVQARWTASNGVTVTNHLTSIGVRRAVRDDDPARSGGPRFSCVESLLDPRQFDALMELARVAQDERLGRWRWPENPDYVVCYRPRFGAIVLRDSEPGSSLTYNRHSAGGIQVSDYQRAARAYFDAHPEPKPWTAVLPGEVWDVDLGRGGIRAVTITSGKHDEPITVFRDVHTQVEIELDDAGIRDARRVWPELT